MLVFPEMTLDSLRSSYKCGRKPVDIVREVRQRILERGADGVWIYLPPLEEALAAARKMTDDHLLPLYGVPFAVKDNIDICGWPTTAGCPEFSYVAAADATVVANLKAAGAIPIGKTNLDQFATGLVGTRSPYGIPSSVFSQDHISGGSSSGSSVAVAAGEVAFSLGTDTAGSGRVPAAFNNLVGLKPSLGLLSTHGVVPACRSLDCVTIFAHRVADAHTIRQVADGFDANDIFSRRVVPRELPLSEPRIGVPHSSQLEFFGNVQAEFAFTAAVNRVQSMGWRIVTIDFTPFRDMALQLYSGPWVAERLAALESFMKHHDDAMNIVVQKIIHGGNKYTAVDAYRAIYEKARLQRLTEREWTKMDVLFLPTVPTHYTIAEVQSDPFVTNSRLGTYTNFVNLLDLAAIAIPAGFMTGGLPFGVMLVSHAGTDSALAVLGMQFCNENVNKPISTSILIAVVGAHLSGQPLNNQLTSRGGTLIKTCYTAPIYKLFALSNTTPAKPSLRRVNPIDGHSIEVEVWDLPSDGFCSFMALIQHPLGIGTIALADGDQVKGFICEPCALEEATDISSFGGWRKYIEKIGSQ